MPHRTRPTTGQQQTIRSNMARKATQLANRLIANAMGELDPALSSGQIKSIQTILSHCLPAMQSVQLEDITEQPTREMVESEYKAALANLSQGDVKTALESMPPEVRRELLKDLREH